MPLLVKVLSISQGDVLEVGTGMFSTPLLHWLCLDQNRNLVSYESQPKWFDMNKAFQSKTHKMFLVDDWGKADIERFWSVAFVDHEPAHRRIEEIKKLADYAQFVVIHDTQPEENKWYKYDRVFPLFKYSYTYTKDKPFTTVVSNFYDVGRLLIDTK